MKILVIGGSGFIGNSLVYYLLKKKHIVTIFDLISPKNHYKNLKFVKGNISNTNLLKKIIQQNKIVYHLAGISDIGEASNKPVETVKKNILSTVNILEICSKFSVKRFIFASTIYVHSSQGGFYRTSKNSAELYIQEYWKSSKLKCTILRYGTIYGPSNNFKNNINKMTNHAIKFNLVKYDGSNFAKRNFIHIDDAAKASIKVLQKRYENKAVLIRGKKNIKIRKIMEIIRRKLNIKNSLKFENKKIEGHYISNPFTYKEPKQIKLVIKKPVKIESGIQQVINFIKKKS